MPTFLVTRTDMRFADIEETKEPAGYRLVHETYGSKLVEV